MPSKRERAQHEIELALASVGKALSLLGGKVRNKPKAWPPPNEYIARQYLESLHSRLHVTQMILAPKQALRTEDDTIAPSKN